MDQYQNINKSLIYLSLLLFPVQILQIPIKTTAIDISGILIFLVFFISLLKNDVEKNKKFFLFFLIFFFFQISLHLISPAPMIRFISSAIWISLFILLIFGNDLPIFDYKIAEKLIKVTLLISLIIAWIQYFFIITPAYYSLGVKLRSMALFMEPSYAGLAFYSASAAFLGLFFFSQKKITNLIYAIIFFLTGFLTLSMHIVTFSVMFFIILFFFFKQNFSYKKFFILLGTLCLIFFIGIIIANYFNIKLIDIFIGHFEKRVNLLNINGMSMSLLAWLMGFDQALYSIKTNLFLGVGLGSTGEFLFDSVFKDRLNILGSGDLTLKDAFSLFFRLIIEIGFFLTISFVLYLIVKTFNVMRNLNSESFKKYIFCFIFSLSLIIGSLLKEPNFGRSSLIVGIMLFTRIPTQKKIFQNKND